MFFGRGDLTAKCIFYVYGVITHITLLSATSQLCGKMFLCSFSIVTSVAQLDGNLARDTKKKKQQVTK
jgi:hypothetical protein